jgi:hypothetical protein
MISGPMLIEKLSHGRSHRRGNYYSNRTECTINLLKLLDDLSPALFLGIIDPIDFSIEDNFLEIRGK